MNQQQLFPLASFVKYSMSTKIVAIGIFIIDGQFKKRSNKVTNHDTFPIPLGIQMWVPN